MTCIACGGGESEHSGAASSTGFTEPSQQAAFDHVTPQISEFGTLAIYGVPGLEAADDDIHVSTVGFSTTIATGVMERVPAGEYCVTVNYLVECGFLVEAGGELTIQLGAAELLVEKPESSVGFLPTYEGYLSYLGEFERNAWSPAPPLLGHVFEGTIELEPEGYMRHHQSDSEVFVIGGELVQWTYPARDPRAWLSITPSEWELTDAVQDCSGGSLSGVYYAEGGLTVNDIRARLSERVAEDGARDLLTTEIRDPLALFVPPPMKDMSYYYFTSGQAIVLDLEAGATTELVLERLGVPHAFEETEDGIFLREGEWSVDVLHHSGTWRPIEPDVIGYTSSGQCQAPTQQRWFPTGTGIDVFPGTYRVEVRYEDTTRGEVVRTYEVTLPSGG